MKLPWRQTSRSTATEAVLSLPPVHALELVDIQHEYPGAQGASRVLDIGLLQVRSGELTCLQGPSGSGKSTLLAVAGTLLTPTVGTVRIGDVTVDFRNAPQLARLRATQIGFVFQDYALFEPLTARENVEVALNCSGTVGRDAARVAADCLASVGLAKHRDMRVRTLSGGQRQRVALARAIAVRPSIVLADEPTANLDAKTGEQIGDLLAEIAMAGHTVLCATHDPRLGKFAARTIVLEDGRVVGDTSPTAVPVPF